MGCYRCEHGPSGRRPYDDFGYRNDNWDRTDRTYHSAHGSHHCRHENCDRHDHHDRRRGRSIIIGFPLWF